MRESGYYPAGAEYDPRAPWNEVCADEKEVEVTVSITLSKTFKIYTNNYEVMVYDQDECGPYEEDVEFINLTEDTLNQITLPCNLAHCIEKELENNKDLKISNSLKESINDCKDWIVDDLYIE